MASRRLRCHPPDSDALPQGLTKHQAMTYEVMTPSHHLEGGDAAVA